MRQIKDSCVDKSNDSVEDRSVVNMYAPKNGILKHTQQTGKIDGEIGRMSEDINITLSNNRLIKDREDPKRLK